jgi:1-acyl-sn-glycerol-3-phosphate acyltransferase
LLFPEGTRSTDGKIHKFKKGGLLLAIETQFPIVPMALCGTGDVAIKGARTLKSASVELRIGKPIDTKGMTYNGLIYHRGQLLKLQIPVKSPL